MSTGETIALATISGLFGAGLRQKTINDLRADVAQLDQNLESYKLALGQAHDTIKSMDREIVRLRQEKAAVLAENSRLREQVPPEDPPA